MTRRALLIGSQTFGLAGCEANVVLMQDVLASRGYSDIQVLTGPAAARDGITSGFEQLIAETNAADAVVIYYSGHGGRVPLPDWQVRQAAGQEAFAQFIVPYDMDETTAADFHGILSLELSRFQSRLTQITSNVTTILDCCHSGLMARDALLVPKALSRYFPYEGALDKLAELEAVSSPVTGDGNPHAVRVVACGPGQSAFEGASIRRPGARHGLLTDALASLLTATDGSYVSWRTLADRLRAVITTVTVTQRPEVEGPSNRVPFTEEEDNNPGAVPVTVTGGQAWVEGAELLGVTAGDQYVLLDEAGRRLGRATAAAPAGGRARLQTVGDGFFLPERVTAVPFRTFTRLPVSVELPDYLRPDAIAAIEDSTSLFVSDAEITPIGSVIFDGGLLVCDGARLPLYADRLDADKPGIRAAVELLERVARAVRFRDLRPTGDAVRLIQPAEVTIVRHAQDGSQVPVTGNGERVFVGDRLSVSVRNLSSQPLYFWVFDVGTSSEIVLVTDASPSGRELAPAGEPDDRQTVGGSGGTALEWSLSAPRDGGRPETLVVIIADRPQDLSPLQSRDAARPQDLSPLEARLAEAQTGVRSWPSESSSASSLRYRVDNYDLILEPTVRPRLDESAFALDERPDQSLRILAPRGASRPPRKVAVRLTALSVRKNRALWRATVRLDAMVITADPHGRAMAVPLTQRFPGIADGDLLPMDNLLMFAGPVHEFVDIAIWVNRDDKHGQSLADLFASEMNQPAVQSALTVAGGLVLAAPTVALGVGAVAAVAELIRVGAHLVTAAVGQHIGLYRTSLLPHESFGVGRHPVTGLHEAQDIQFAFEVIEQP